MNITIIIKLLFIYNYLLSSVTTDKNVTNNNVAITQIIEYINKDTGFIIQHYICNKVNR